MIGLTQVSMDTIYTKTYGNSFFGTWGYSVLELPNDSLLLSTGYQGDESYCDMRPKLYKADSQGDTVWSFYGVPGSGPIIRTADGHFANIQEIHTPSNCGLDTIMVNKFDVNGNTFWSKKYHFGEVYNKATDIIETLDSGFAISCYYAINPFGSFYHSAVIKLDKYGNTQWIKHFGTQTTMHEAKSIVQTNSGEYGIICFDGQDTQYTLMKLNQLGDTLWTRTFAPPSGLSGYCDLTLLPTNQFLIVCNGFDGDALLAKIDQNGVIDHYRLYTPNEGIGNGVMGKVMYLPNQHVYLIATNQLYLTDISGDIIWSGDLSTFSIEDVIQLSNDDIFVIGSSYIGETSKIRLLRYSISGVSDLAIEQLKEIDFVLFPNPCKKEVSISIQSDPNKEYLIELTDLLGKSILQSTGIGGNALTIPLLSQSPGIYLFSVIDPETNLKQTRQLIIE